ncbi:MAG TPA: hypothetical protein VIC27_07230, partial [Ktedonobacterales bacterium]
RPLTMFRRARADAIWRRAAEGAAEPRRATPSHAEPRRATPSKKEGGIDCAEGEGSGYAHPSSNEVLRVPWRHDNRSGE